MSDDKIQKLLLRYNKAKTDLDNWKDLLGAAYKLSQADRNLFRASSIGGENKLNKVYDPTLMDATTAFVSKLQNSLTPPFRHWAQLVAGEEVPESKKQDINKTLQIQTNILFKFINQSNFNLVANEAYFDLAVGTAAILVNEGDDNRPLIFSTVPAKQFLPEESEEGLVENVFRDFTGGSDINSFLIAQIQQMWPRAILPGNLLRKLESNPLAKTAIVDATIYDHKKKLYTYSVISVEEKKIMWETVSESSPWVVGRWEKIPGETRGRGQILKALPTAWRLNQLADYQLRGVAFQSMPMWLAYNDGVFNPYQVRLKPGGILVVNQQASAPGFEPIRPLPVGGNYEISEAAIERMERQINSIMFTQPFGSLDTSPRTATEISLRQQEMLEKIGPAIGRFQVEFLNKLIKRVVFILKKKGLMNNIKIDGKEITLKYESPLAQSEGLNNVQKFQQMAGIIQQTFGPQAAIAAFRAADVPQWVAGNLNLDPNIINSADDMKALAEKIQQQQKQQQAQEPQPGTIGQQPEVPVE